MSVLMADSIAGDGGRSMFCRSEQGWPKRIRYPLDAFNGIAPCPRTSMRATLSFY